MDIENLKELKKEKGMSSKQIAEKAGLPEKTVSRIFSGDTDSPYVDTLHRIVKVLDGSLDDILADTKAVVGDTKLATLSETVDTVSTELDQLQAENARLKAEVALLNSQLTLLLQQELKHKDEIIALHDFYNKRKPSGIGWVD